MVLARASGVLQHDVRNDVAAIAAEIERDQHRGFRIFAGCEFAKIDERPEFAERANDSLADLAGREFFERTRAMTSDRFSGVSESTTKSYAPCLGASNGHLSAIYCSLASRTTHASDTFFWRAMSSSVW